MKSESYFQQKSHKFKHIFQICTFNKVYHIMDDTAVNFVSPTENHFVSINKNTNEFFTNIFCAVTYITCKISIYLLVLRYPYIEEKVEFVDIYAEIITFLL